MTDDMVISMYRTQKLLNLLLNEIMATVLISFHQVGLLVTTTAMPYFGIKFQTVIHQVGIIGYFTVYSIAIAPLCLVCYQSIYFGRLVEITQTFKPKGLHLFPRKLLFHKFARSCETFNVEEAYPFYRFNRETFLLFCEQVLNYTVTLILW